jgi:hypothetical protein
MGGHCDLFPGVTYRVCVGSTQLLGCYRSQKLRASARSGRELARRRHRWRTTYVGGWIPPRAVVACQRLWPDTKRPTYIGRRVPPLAWLACQRLWPDTERPADLARRVPPLAIHAVGRAHRGRRDRHGCHRRERHHDDDYKMANERAHCGPPLVTYASSNRARARRSSPSCSTEPRTGRVIPA